MRRYRPTRVPAGYVEAHGEFVASAFGQKHAARRDGNDAELVAHAELLGGYFVRSGPLEGWCWVPRLGKWMPVEIKRAEVEGEAREFTPAQQRFLTWCRNHGAPFWVWRSLDDVERDLGARRGA